MDDHSVPLHRSVAIRILAAMALAIAVALATLALVAGRAAAREFRGYLVGGAGGSGVVADRLSAYYQGRGSWEGAQRLIGSPATVGHPGMGGMGGMMGDPLVVADAAGLIVAGPARRMGDRLVQTELDVAQPILADGKLIGYLVPSGVGPSAIEEETLGRIRQSILMAAIVSGIVATLAGGALATSILRPIRDLTAASSRISAGDLSPRVRKRSHDELGLLADSFNRMAGNLERAERLRRDMTADVAHELRTPLSVLQARLEGVVDGVYPASRQTMISALEQTRVISRLIDDLGTLALSDAGHLGLETAPLDLNALAAAVVDSHQAYGVAVRLRAWEGTLLVEGDAIRLQQVVANLLSNALRHAGTDGEVTVRTQATQEWATLEVEDSGEGIPPESLPVVFERFYRADRARSRADGGSGLGLAIARNLVQAHGGHLSAANRPEGGAVFTVRLPRLPSKESEA
jgi:two-component system sensor histidine kinase BaeS